MGLVAIGLELVVLFSLWFFIYVASCAERNRLLKAILEELKRK